mgnify:CR=1 FL=1
MVKSELGTTMSVGREYSVLYSSRVQQKTKNWSDGTLKFYRFNNRVDVFNVDGHLIASDFFNPSRDWKQIEEQYFTVGKEFTLPSGQLLVEIDEFVSEFTREIPVRGLKSVSPKHTRDIRLISTAENKSSANIGKAYGKHLIKREKISVKLEKESLNNIDANYGISRRIPRQSSTHLDRKSVV